MASQLVINTMFLSLLSTLAPFLSLVRGLFVFRSCDLPYGLTSTAPSLLASSLPLSYLSFASTRLQIGCA
ncbi:hypothetical protein F4823DRAFT_607309 [Ustulina deusta]|nr:hypothetical protein F4823DRAFT_607309 [Ustulina deusta]